MNKQNIAKSVVVPGDVTIDWNVARIRRTEGMAQAWTADEVTATFCQPGICHGQIEQKGMI